jgi:hypothetical protein
MFRLLTSDFLKFKKFLTRTRRHFDNRELITNILSNLIITLGVVLIVGGLFLIVSDPGTSNSAQANMAARSVIDTTAWIPGLPFFLGDIASCSITAIGLVSWLMGINLLLTGLGLWIRHRLARLVALTIFSVSNVIQFAQFMLLGVVGAPYSIVLLILNGVIAYFLFTKFDSRIRETEIEPIA